MTTFDFKPTKRENVSLLTVMVDGKVVAEAPLKVYDEEAFVKALRMWPDTVAITRESIERREFDHLLFIQDMTTLSTEEDSVSATRT